MLAYIFVPVVQRELDVFRTTVWNNNRGRKQRDKELPTGVPEHMYNFPEKYQAEHFGITIDEEQVQFIADEFEAALNETKDYILEEERAQFEQVIPSTDDISANEAADVFRYLKSSLV